MGRLRERFPALLALAIPVGAGLAYLSVAGAPARFIGINESALIGGLILAAFLSAPASLKARRIIVGLMLLALFVPLLTGPSVEGVARWFPVGPFTLHAAGLLLPAILVLAAREEEYAAPVMLVAIFAGLLQPDAALGFAVVFAAVGLHDVTRNWRIGLTCILAFVGSLIMAMRANPPPQPFVERVLVDAANLSLGLSVALFLALVASFFLILLAIPAVKSTRYTLAGSLFGFTMMSLMSNYPSVLIGYGAAPILGYGLALALAHDPRPASP